MSGEAGMDCPDNCPTCDPTPEPSEVAETTAGEREGCHVGYPYCDGRRPCACPCHDPAEPDAGDVEALAKVVAEADPDAAEYDVARAVLASPWLAARVSAAETNARAEAFAAVERELREYGDPDSPVTPHYPWTALADAKASIARGDAR